MPRGSKPGERRGGRQKGTPNKITRTVRQNTLEAFERLGGINGFVEWAGKNRAEFYRHYAAQGRGDPDAQGGQDNPINSRTIHEIVFPSAPSKT
jgi:hypothetical protein